MKHIAHALSYTKKPYFTMREIQGQIKILVCKEFSIDLDVMLMRTRKPIITEPRHAWRYLLRKYYPKLSLSYVAYLTGCTHHATVLSSIREANSLKETDKEYKKKIESIEAKIDKLISMEDNPITIKEFSKMENWDKKKLIDEL